MSLSRTASMPLSPDGSCWGRFPSRSRSIRRRPFRSRAVPALVATACVLPAGVAIRERFRSFSCPSLRGRQPSIACGAVPPMAWRCGNQPPADSLTAGAIACAVLLSSQSNSFAASSGPMGAPQSLAWIACIRINDGHPCRPGRSDPGANSACHPWRRRYQSAVQADALCCGFRKDASLP